MATPPTYPLSNEQSFPPMPRRQSCDRCHEQKVRCVTSGYEGVPGLGPIAEEDETTLGRQVVAEIPCVRCSKAGATCIFSPQLRSGRPRVHKAPTPPSSRKRRNRAPSSRCSSFSPLSSPALSPAVSQSSSPQTLPVNLAPGSVGYASMTPSLAGSPAALPQYYPREHELKEHALSDQWLLPSLHPPNAQLPGHDPLSFGSLREHEATSVHDYTLLLNRQFQCTTSMAEPTLTADYSWTYPNLPDTEVHTDNSFPDEFSQMNLRLHRATQTLSRLPTASLSLSSPPVNEVFDASCSFINTVDRYASSHSRNGHNPVHAHDPHPTTTTIDKAAETSIGLMVLACHQLIVGSLEYLCSSLHSQLMEAPAPAHVPLAPGGGQAGNFWKPSTPPPPPNTQQILAMVNMISHLLTQLERSIELFSRKVGQEGGTSIVSVVLDQCEHQLLGATSQVDGLKLLLRNHSERLII